MRLFFQNLKKISWKEVIWIELFTNAIESFKIKMQNETLQENTSYPAPALEPLVRPWEH